GISKQKLSDLFAGKWLRAPATTQAPEIAGGLGGFVRPAPRGLCSNCVRTRRAGRARFAMPQL
ncbi:MAG TPA: hypothetical protein VGA62_00115, partial [Acidimicrobiia bacterium]